MKKIFITVSSILLIILNIIVLLYSDKSYGAKKSNNTSDLQLMARAINGEARGEPYEGQVAVRSSYIK